MKIITTPITFELHGFTETAVNKDYAAAAFKGMNRLWAIVKSNQLKNKGLNVWVYEPGEKIFAGVELLESPGEFELEKKIVTLDRYAYHKHIGPYSLIKSAGQTMTNELKNRGLQTRSTYIEVYGHWTDDEARLETELYMGLL